MKKYYLIFLFIASILFINAQTDSLLKVNRSIKLDSLIDVTSNDSNLNAKTDTIFISPKQNETKTNQTFPNRLKENIEELNILNSISIFLIIEILLILLLAKICLVLINRWLTNRTSTSKYFYFEAYLNVIKFAIWTLAFFTIFTLLFNFEEYFYLALSISFIIFIGIASIGVLKNLIGYILINFSKNLNKGDLIEINNQVGELLKTNLRYTILIQSDNQQIFVPNSLFISNTFKIIKQIQKEDFIELEYKFSIDESDEYIKKILMEAAISSPYTFLKTQPKVELTSLDYFNKFKIYRIYLYISSIKYKSEMISFINYHISKSIKNKN